LAVDGVLLAGAPNQGPLREIASVDHEALITIGGRPMFLYVLEALLAAPQMKRIGIVGPRELDQPLGWPEGVFRVDPAGDLIANVFCGLEALGSERPVLIATADIPLLGREAVEGFLDECAKIPGDFYYPLIPRDIMERSFPHLRRTYFTLREGSFTGGNLLLLRPGAALGFEDLLQEVIAFRKKPWRIVSLLGLSFGLRFLLKQLAIGDAVLRIEELTGLRGVAVVCPWAEIGFDVDKPDQFHAVKAVLERGNGGR
jgi:hypothetical protein